MNKQTIHFDMELFQGYTQSTFPSISFQKNNFITIRIWHYTVLKASNVSVCRTQVQ